MSRGSSVHPPSGPGLAEPREAERSAVPVAAAADEDAASSGERRLELNRRREDEGGRVVEFPRPVSTTRRRAEPTAAAEPETEESVARPEYLASELLRQEWFPRTPLARTLRWGALALGAGGAAGTLALGGVALGPLALAAILAGCAIVGALPMSAERRGGVLALFGMVGVAIAGFLQMDSDPAAPLLAFGVALTAGTLLFRAAHRASRFARPLVAAGLVILASWLVLDGGLEALQVASFAWQDWLDPVARLALGLVLLAGMLTFVDPSGHGGAYFVGAALVGWFGASGAATMAIAAGSADGADPGAWVATFAQPFFAALAAGGLCQLFAQLSRSARAERTHAG